MDQEAQYWRKRGVELDEGMEEFFDGERKRRQNQNRSDERNGLTFTGMAAPEPRWDGYDPVFEAVYHRIRHQKLVNALFHLSEEDQDLIVMYFFRENSMEEIGIWFRISKMAVSKRMKNALHEMRVLMEA